MLAPVPVTRVALSACCCTSVAPGWAEAGRKPRAREAASNLGAEPVAPTLPVARSAARRAVGGGAWDRICVLPFASGREVRWPRSSWWLTLAVGIGANTAIFSVVNGVLVRPLPYPDAGQLVVVYTELQDQGETMPASSSPEFQDLLDHADAFASLGAMWYRPAALTDDGVEPEDIDMAFVSAGLLPTLGVEPLLGRFPRPEEDHTRSRVVVLAHDTWQRRYGGDPDLVGKTIEFDGVAQTVVGVMPAEFRMLFPPDVRMPPAWPRG